MYKVFGVSNSERFAYQFKKLEEAQKYFDRKILEAGTSVYMVRGASYGK